MSMRRGQPIQMNVSSSFILISNHDGKFSKDSWKLSPTVGDFAGPKKQTFFLPIRDRRNMKSNLYVRIYDNDHDVLVTLPFS